MKSPFHHKISSFDPLNNEIWKYLHSTHTDSLSTLEQSKYSIDLMLREIQFGCSPCPDILTQDFGKKTSVMFISTVYGLIYEYLKKSYQRQTDDWHDFTNDFYRDIIQKNEGIYTRLGDIYNQVSVSCGFQPEFCFTELVKTVLIDLKGNVSGLHQPSFIRYFLKHEAQFLSERLKQIDSKCYIFTFSEVATFFSITTLASIPNPLGVEKLPDNIEVKYMSENQYEDIQFFSKLKRSGSVDINFNTKHGSFSSTIAFRTIFKLTDKEIYVIPLPHPSTSNNANWSGDFVGKQMKLLLDFLF